MCMNHEGIVINFTNLNFTCRSYIFLIKLISIKILLILQASKQKPNYFLRTYFLFNSFWKMIIWHIFVYCMSATHLDSFVCLTESESNRIDIEKLLEIAILVSCYPSCWEQVPSQRWMDYECVLFSCTKILALLFLISFFVYVFTK
jgi:hypothetical protein